MFHAEGTEESVIRGSEDVKDLHSKEASASLELNCGADVFCSVDNGSFEGAEKNERMELGATTERSTNGDEEEIIVAAISILLEASGPDQSAGVMQEPIFPLEIEGDADVRTEEQTESRVWMNYVLVEMRVTRTAIKSVWTPEGRRISM